MSIDKMKKFGVFYTPNEITKFSSRHIFKDYIDGALEYIEILEPSVGDGQFIVDILKDELLGSRKLVLDAVDINQENIRDFTNRLPSLQKNIDLNTYAEDFLVYETKKKYDLIVGNPPYIGKKDLTIAQREICKAINRKNNDSREIKNIWTAFVYKCINLLKKNGTICLVLPIELLHVNYTSNLRDSLRERFNKIEVFTFSEIVFKNTLQDVVLLFASNSNLLAQKGISFYEVKKLADLAIPDYTKKYFNIHRKNAEKWTNYILTDNELEFIDSCKSRLKCQKMLNYCSKIEVGIVTAANHYFILNNTSLNNYALEDLAVPIIQKGSFVNSTWCVDEDYFQSLNEKDYPCWLIQFENIKASHMNQNHKKYLDIGKDQDVHLGFKTKQRNNWYHVPQKWIGDAFLVKRIHDIPKMIVNEAAVQSTDALYLMKILPIFDVYNILYSFYNVLTFIDCELKGRYYGGGVLELTPNEYKAVELPYVNVSSCQLEEFKTQFASSRIKNFLFNNSKAVLSTLSTDEMDKLFHIYNKLIERRRK